MTLLCPCPQCATYTLESFMAGQAARFVRTRGQTCKKTPACRCGRCIWRLWREKKTAEYMRELARLIEERK